jgi:hypothetical protein
VINFTPRPLYSSEGVPVPVEYEAECVPDPVWKFRRREKSFALIGILTLYREANNIVLIPTRLLPLNMYVQ